MGYWNYRLVRYPYTHLNGAVEITTKVHEVHYNSQDQIYAISKEPVSPQGSGEDDKESVIECVSDLELMLEAANRPVIDLSTVVYGKPDWEQ